MYKSIQAIIYAATLASATPFPGDGGDSTHIETQLAGALSDQVTCPEGWIAGVGSDESTYCFNCGLPDKPILGCNPGCSSGSCSAIRIKLAPRSPHPQFKDKASSSQVHIESSTLVRERPLWALLRPQCGNAPQLV